MYVWDCAYVCMCICVWEYVCVSVCGMCVWVWVSVWESMCVWGEYVLLWACWGQRTSQLSHSTMWNPEIERAPLGLVANALTHWANSLVLTHNIFISEEKIINAKHHIKKISGQILLNEAYPQLCFFFFYIEVCKYLIPNIFLVTDFLPFYGALSLLNRSVRKTFSKLFLHMFILKDSSYLKSSPKIIGFLDRIPAQEIQFTLYLGTWNLEC